MSEKTVAIKFFPKSRERIADIDAMTEKMAKKGFRLLKVSCAEDSNETTMIFAAPTHA